ncbi:UDP-N-acetylmuramoyl-tripeptide--D-alanyl-D-alanine ligase [Cytobacillus sp. FSL W7-1323]|uniref:UDP-N-acetylmuramoyl-tripeptide--D-alanyl-D- alanine ligase n=1 Tax=Cytobacillus TaxID=2675230 RepID=UPI0027872855|nr:MULTISPECIES: UDP-N-acetylmuramoyl-tripeptide--D-alanyl-D-alanine ligase [Cytobacillus]MDQ0185451.1 UDP-N-acetylmuramoyl-tripeptide--D-alanyl-D-alanine ligase [Cytobacillus kochii]MEA1855005.1 UDP-N-acetylmuramoyl-tripeptide--D-alanyl-D-alanine ligase [Cytobacillus sp. OWB-43]
MIKRTLNDIAEMIQIENDLSPYGKKEIQGVSINSREITPGQLFIPFKGERTDGHQYVSDAIEKGAAAAFWQEDVPNPPTHLPIIIVKDTLTALQELARAYRNQLSIKVVGITGSNGKTTTKDMMANLLALKYKVQKTEGNYNNHIGLPLTILALEETTEVAVLEMGMSGKGEIDFLTKLARPDATIITNIGESHLQDLGSREGIAEAKLEIINGLKSDGLMVYMGDEPLLRNYFDSYEGQATVKTFGRTEQNDLYPVNIQQLDNGSKFQVNASEVEFTLPILGMHNVLNALSAMIVAQHFNVSFAEMEAGLVKVRLTNMRMEILQGQNGEKIINDAYNASPTSTQASIELLANLPGYKKKILVLGDMLELGADEERFHEEIGLSICAENIDAVFTYGRLGHLIAKGAKEVLSEDRVFAFDEKAPLIEELKKHVNDETIVLVKASRGMKLEEVVEGLQ